MKKTVGELLKISGQTGPEYKSFKSEVEDLCRNGRFKSAEKKGSFWYIDNLEFSEFMQNKSKKEAELSVSQNMNRCPSCNAKVSKQAFTCPSCGNPLRYATTRSAFGFLGILLILFIFGAVFFGIISLGL